MKRSTGSLAPGRAIGLGICVVLLCAAAAARAVAPRADSEFGGDRLALLRHPPQSGKARVQTSIVDLANVGQGRFVAAIGRKSPEASFAGHGRWFIGAARFRANGSLDPSFGRGGFARLIRPALGRARGLVHGQAEAVAVAPDGKAIIAGYRNRGPHSRVRYPVLVRLLPDGRMDRRFGRGGVVTPGRVGGLGEWFSDVAIAPGGRIVAVGARTQSPIEDWGRQPKPATLVRAFRSDGTLDRGFAGDGTLLRTAPRGTAYTALRSVHVLPGGRLLVSGYRFDRPLLERLTPDGRPDRTFGRGGEALLGPVTEGCWREICARPSSLIVSGRGKVRALFMIDRAAVGSPIPVLARFLPDGSLDRSFGRGGKVNAYFEEAFAWGEAIVPAAAGRSYLVGFGHDRRSHSTQMRVLRLGRDGRLDRRFAEKGWWTLRRGYASTGSAALVRPGGRVVAGGAMLGREPGIRAFVPQQLVLRRLGG